MKKIVILLTTVITLLVFKGPKVFSQSSPTKAAQRMEAFEQRKKLAENSLAGSIKFRSVGPTIMSGRVVDVEVDPADPKIFYVAYASGG